MKAGYNSVGMGFVVRPRPRPLLRIATRFRDRFAVVELSGRLDASLDLRLMKEFERLKERGTKDVILDCAGLDYLSSRGVSAFIAGLDDLRGRGGDLKLIRVRPEAALVLDRLGVSHVIQRFETEDAAVRAFATPIEDFLSAGGLEVFMAAGGGGTFHASSCSSVRRIRQPRTFASKKEAREAGLRPCRRCLKAGP